MTEDDDLDFRGKNKSGVKGELKVTREEVRAIKKLAEKEMREESYQFRLGGNTWADLDALRERCMIFLRDNQ